MRDLSNHRGQIFNSFLLQQELLLSININFAFDLFNFLTLYIVPTGSWLINLYGEIVFIPKEAIVINLLYFTEEQVI